MENKTNSRIYALLILVLIVGAFVLGWFYAGYKGQKTASRPAPIPPDSTLALTAMPVKVSDNVSEKSYVGFVTPIHEAEVQPYISGYIDNILVEGGQSVQKGQVLLTLRQNEYIAQMASAQADVLKAEATFKNAETYYDRIEKAGVKAVSQTDLDNAQAQFLEAKAALEQSKANLALAEVNFDYTVIKAPIDGVVGDVSLTKGNYVSPSSGVLFSIVQYNPIRVVFSITDKEYLAELNKPFPFESDEIFVRLADGTLFPNKGVFEYTDNTVNRATNAVAVYTKFENEGKLLTPNAYVTILLRRTFKNSVQVPKSAVSLEENGNFVYTIRSGVLHKTPIQILASLPTVFIVSNTFETGDFIITQSVNATDIGKPAGAILKEQKGMK